MIESQAWAARAVARPQCARAARKCARALPRPPRASWPRTASTTSRSPSARRRASSAPPRPRPCRRTTRSKRAARLPRALPGGRASAAHCRAAPHRARCHARPRALQPVSHRAGAKGHRRPYAEIELQLFPESAKEVEIFLLERRIPHATHEGRRFSGDRAHAMSVLSLTWQDAPLKLSVFDPRDERVALKTSQAGRVMDRAGIAEVGALLRDGDPDLAGVGAWRGGALARVLPAVRSGGSWRAAWMEVPVARLAQRRFLATWCGQCAPLRRQTHCWDPQTAMGRVILRYRRR